MAPMNGNTAGAKGTQPPNSTVGPVLENLGAHGIPNIKRAQNNYRRVFWVVLFVGGLAAFIIHSYLSVRLYLRYDVTVNLDIHYQPIVPFPAITICNLNGVKESILTNFTDLNDLFGSNTASAGGAGGAAGGGPPNGGPQPPPGQPTTLLPTTTSYGTTPSTGRKKYQDWDNIDYREMESGHTLIKDLTNIIGAMDYNERFSTGHDLDDMLLSCSFGGFPCGPKNFTWFYNYLYGNCYTFNSGVNMNVVDVATSGPLYGLTMSLYIQQDEYIPDIQQGAGVRVDVHSEKEMSFPEDNGVNVSPGTEAFISVEKTFIYRKGYPYTNCSNNFVNSTIFAEHFPHVEYSKMTCEKDCYFQVLFSKCGCADIRYRYDDDVMACNETDPVQDQCQDRVTEAYESGMIPCNCTFKCQEDIFHTSTSYSLWPNDKYKPTVEEGIREISDSLMRSLNNDSSFIEKNVVKLNVFYSSLSYEYIYHTATYNEYELLSDLGGNVGLWIGISVLTIFELIELLYDVIMLCCLKCTGRKSGKRVNASDMELDRIDAADNQATSSSMDKKTINANVFFVSRPSRQQGGIRTEEVNGINRRTPRTHTVWEDDTDIYHSNYSRPLFDVSRVVYNPGHNSNMKVQDF